MQLVEILNICLTVISNIVCFRYENHQNIYIAYSAGGKQLNNNMIVHVFKSSLQTKQYCNNLKYKIPVSVIILICDIQYKLDIITIFSVTLV